MIKGGRLHAAVRWWTEQDRKQRPTEACMPWRIASERVESATSWLATGEGTNVMQNRLGLLASELRAEADRIHDEKCRGGNL